MARKETYSTLTACFMLVLAAGNPSEIRSESLLQPGETSILSFSLEDGRQVFLCAGEDEEYLTFRLWTTDSLAVQYPAVLDTSSWHLFEYSFYFRGGGAANLGLDLNWLAFEIDSVMYTMYDEYYSEDESHHTGLRMTSPDGEVDLEGVPGSVTGSLIPFMFDYYSLVNR